jgi:hypothetical protein
MTTEMAPLADILKKWLQNTVSKRTHRPMADERRKSTGLIKVLWNWKHDDKLQCRFVGGERKTTSTSE